MTHKCDGCFYKTDWKDVVDNFPICERLWNTSFIEAKDECVKPGACQNYLSSEKAHRLIEKFNEK